MNCSRIQVQEGAHKLLDHYSKLLRCAQIGFYLGAWVLVVVADDVGGVKAVQILLVVHQACTQGAQVIQPPGILAGAAIIDSQLPGILTGLAPIQASGEVHGC